MTRCSRLLPFSLLSLLSLLTALSGCTSGKDSGHEEEEEGAAPAITLQNFPALAAASGGRFIPVPGGVLILDGVGNAIGAVGISGDASDKDEYCAITAVQEAGCASEPAAPHPDWRAAGL